MMARHRSFIASRHLVAALGLLLVLGASACSSTSSEVKKYARIDSMKGAFLDIFEDDPLSKANPTAEAMYQDGMNYFERKRYDRAIFFFQKVRDEFPFSPEAEAAELKIAEAYRLNGEYVEAAEAFKNYLAFQPTGEKAHYIKYKLGLVHFDQFSRIDRDQKNLKTAKQYFEALINDHPESEYIPEAQEKLAKVREYLAERELYIGNFYMREKKYLAARARFENVLREYMDTPTAVKALYQLGEAYRREKNYVKASLAYEALLQRYPESLEARQGQAQLARLKKEKHDPLASLLMRDTVLPLAPPPPDFAPANVALGNRVEGGLNLVAKEDYEHEEINNAGLLTRLNPFSSSGDEAPKDQANELGDGVVADGGGSQEPEKEKGFWSGLFGATKERKKDEAPKDEAKTEPVFDRIDENLASRGVDATGNDVIEQTPKADLASATEQEKTSDLPASDPAAVLSRVDEEMGAENTSLELPEPPEPSKLFASTDDSETQDEKTESKAAQQKESAGETTSGFLANIDSKLEAKGLEQPNIELPTEEYLQEQQVRQAETAATREETVELSPRIRQQDEQPLLLKTGEFSPERPREASYTEESAADPNSALADAIVKGPPEIKKTAPTEPEKSSDANWDEEKNPVEQVSEGINDLQKTLNPLAW